MNYCVWQIVPVFVMQGEKFGPFAGEKKLPDELDESSDTRLMWEVNAHASGYFYALNFFGDSTHDILVLLSLSVSDS